MRIIDLALKDIRQVLRDKRSLLFLLLMPVAFTFFFGFAFGAQSAETDPRLKIGIIDRDPEGILSTTLRSLLDSSSTVRPVLVADDVEALDAQVVKGQLAAGIILPEGFSRATLLGESPRFTLVLDTENDNGQTVRRAMQTSVTRLMGLVQIARASLAAYEKAVPALDEAARLEYLADAIRRGLDAWQTPPVVAQVASAERAASTDPLQGNPYNQFSPGMIVQFAVFGLVQAAMAVVMERRNGAMARLLTTPMTKAELIAGHLLGSFVIFFLQQLLLVVFGQFVLQVHYFNAPLAILAVIASLSLLVASLGLLISALVKQEEQVIIWTMLAMFIFSALGGAWFSLEMVGGAFAAIGRLTPGAWAIQAFQNIAIRGQGFASVLLPVGMLLAYAAAFFGIAVWRFRYE